MDIKILELATQLTDKAMGAATASTHWVGSEDKVAKFLQTIAHTLDRLYNEDSQD